MKAEAMSPIRLDPLQFPLRGSHLIEASAGTGKTFTIALLYVRLVIGHQPDAGWGRSFVPPEILVMTFTEAATKELRDRIRARLTEAAAVFAQTPDEAAGVAGSDPLLALRSSIAASDWPACVRKLQLAAEWMDEAAVSTIHSWCNRMLNEHAFDSGSFFRQALETDLSDLHRSAMEDYWRTFVYTLEDEAAAALLSFWRTPAALAAPVYRLLDYVDQLPHADTDGYEQLARAAAELGRLKTRWQTLAAEIDDALQALFKTKQTNGKLQKRWWDSWYAKLNAWATDPALIQPELSDSAWNRLTPAGIAEGLKTPLDLPGHPAWTLLGDVGEQAARVGAAKPAILCHAARWLATRLEQEKQRLAAMSFNDLLIQLDAALAGDRGDRLAAVIRQQFPVALVDEFQDTDPVQYRILTRIYRIEDNDPDTTVVLIGDPKQAIYAFRNADIFTYLTARDATRGRHYSLPRNFRSTRAMVNAVNKVFSTADRQLEKGAFILGAAYERTLAYPEVTAQGRDQAWTVQGRAMPALTFWTTESVDPGKSLNKDQFRETQAEACASEIVRLLQLGHAGEAGFQSDTGFVPVRARDIAVLVNGRTEANTVRRALARRRVRSVYLSDRNPVLETAEARDMLFWLRAAAEPDDLAALRAALATATLSRSHAALETLQLDELALDDEIDRFREYRLIWQQQGVLPMLRQLMLDYGVPARLLTQEEGERRLTDVLHIAEILQQESQNLDGEHALIRHFTAMMAETGSQSELLQVRLESEASLVQVVTVHKSKGLEYPLVFLPFASDSRDATGRHKPFPAQWHDRDGQLCLSVDPTTEHYGWVDEERLGEDVRKLYVALTRARYATWVGLGPVENWQRSGIGYLLCASGTDEADTVLERVQTFCRDFSDTVVQPAPEADLSVYDEGEPEPLGAALESHRVPAENWWIASYSALTYGATDEADAVPDDAPDDPAEATLREELDIDLPGSVMSWPASSVHHFPRGAGPGTFLHELLEWAADQGFSTVVQDPSELTRVIDLRCRLRGWEAWVPLLTDWVLTLLAMPMDLPSSHAPCRLTGLQTYRSELEFWFASHQVDTRALDALATSSLLPGQRRPVLEPRTLNGMLKGFIDLVFEHDGRFYVLDYKSNALGEGDEDYRDDVMAAGILAHRYDLQYLLYTLALHRLLKARLPDYDYDRHMGGAVYLFLRGCHADSHGVFRDRPSRETMMALDDLFSDAGAEAVA